MSHRVAPCDGFDSVVGNIADQEQKGKIRTILREYCRHQKVETFSDTTGWIFKQVKESGSVNRPRLGSQRTATPTAQGILPVFNHLKKCGSVLQPSTTAYGSQLPKG